MNELRQLLMMLWAVKSRELHLQLDMKKAHTQTHTKNYKPSLMGIKRTFSHISRRIHSQNNIESSEASEP